MLNRVAAAVLAVTLPADAFAGTEDVPACYPTDMWGSVVAVASGDVLDVRAEPSPTAGKLGELAHDADGFEVKRRVRLGTGASWCLIRHGRLWGWVNARFIEIYGDA